MSESENIAIPLVYKQLIYTLEAPYDINDAPVYMRCLGLLCFTF